MQRLPMNIPIVNTKDRIVVTNDDLQDVTVSIEKPPLAVNSKKNPSSREKRHKPAVVPQPSPLLVPSMLKTNLALAYTKGVSQVLS